MSAVIESHHDDHHHGPAKGFSRWLYTTNHKDIGSLYLWFSFIMLFVGGAMAMVLGKLLSQAVKLSLLNFIIKWLPTMA